MMSTLGQYAVSPGQAWVEDMPYCPLGYTRGSPHVRYRRMCLESDSG